MKSMNADFHGRKFTPLPEVESSAFPAKSASPANISRASSPFITPLRLFAFYLHIGQYHGRSGPLHGHFLAHYPRRSTSTPGLIGRNRYDDSATPTEEPTPVRRPLRGRL